MLLEMKDLAIIALIATLVIFYFIIRLLRRIQPADSSVKVEKQPKVQRSSRIIRFLEEEGFSYEASVPELELRMQVNDREQKVRTGQNVAILTRDGKRYLLKNKTGAMAGKKSNSPIIRNALLEMLASYPADGIILFDSERDRYQLVSISMPRRRSNRLLVYALLVLSMALSAIILWQRLGG